MTSVIAGQGSRPYGATMPAVILRLFIVVALALMPFGMAGSRAIAAAVPAAAAGHCGEHQKPADAPAKMKMHCASCAALPSIQTTKERAYLGPEVPRHLKAMALPGTEPETATPPPRLS